MPDLPPESDAANPRLAMRAIEKRFGATRALKGVDLDVRAGEVLALLGENGAGKSTLMKVLAGALEPDAGTMTLEGASYAPANPQAGRAAGVAMIYQELTLAPHLTIEENIVLGIESRRFGFIQRNVWRRRVRDALARLDGRLRPDALVASLPPAARQLVEIARALALEAKVIVMDEPTSSLGAHEIDQLFTVIDALRRDGVAVIYISHFLEEVKRVADRFTVLRDGETVGHGDVRTTSIDAMVELMIGRKLDDLFPHVPREIGEPILEIRDLTGDPLPHDVSLELRRGEVFGVAGLVGAGRTEFLRALFGLDPVRQGEVRIGTMWQTRHDSVSRMRHGVGLLSEDRAGEGLALGRSIADNMLLSRLRPYVRSGRLSRKRMREAAEKHVDTVGIRVRDVDQPVGDLSGGNQQKVALARLLHHDVDVLLLDEPTRGVDVGSKAQIYRLIGDVVARGKAVIVVSSYTPELLGICDRIAVMHRGRLGVVRPTAQWTEHDIMAAAVSGRDRADESESA